MASEGKRLDERLWSMCINMGGALKAYIPVDEHGVTYTICSNPNVDTCPYLHRMTIDIEREERGEIVKYRRRICLAEDYKDVAKAFREER